MEYYPRAMSILGEVRGTFGEREETDLPGCCPDSNRSGRSPIPGIREATAACWQSSQLLHALLLLSAPALDGASVSMDNAQEQVRPDVEEGLGKGCSGGVFL